jgi:hypothetical protein
MGELEEVRHILQEGVRLSRQLSYRRHADALRAIRLERFVRRRSEAPSALPRGQAEIEEELRAAGREATERMAAESLRIPLLKEVSDYCERHGLEITNRGGKPHSVYEPPREAWRPLAANFGTHRPDHVLSRLQRHLFGRLFDRLDDHVFVYPASGFDPPYLERGHFVLVDREPKEPKLPPGAKLHYINKEAQRLTDEDLREAHRKLRLPMNRPRALILKGLQSLVAPADLRKVFAEVRPDHVVAFGSAASGFAQPREVHGLPTLDPSLESLIKSQGYRDVTREFFRPEELDRLDEIHALLRDHFSWGVAHFPASQVRVYRRATA